ncbi:MAG: tetratricopeptide repeat protein, partial [Chloroflexi bacterium]|nr:tetratricopeptide repeat protein [Chloroflexota bacterium]
MGTYTSDLNQLLAELRQAVRKPDRALLDRIRAYGQGAVRPLIEMAVDEDLHNADSKSPEVWAPLHAIQLLGELGASEAIEPLLPLFDRVDDDYLAQTLPEAFGGIGAPAVGPLRALLFDRSKDIFARARAAEGLSKIGQLHHETRSDVVNALVARLDPVESQSPKDEILNGFVIAELLHMKAVEAATAIRQAFAEDRVDTSIVDLDHALEELGLSPESPRAVKERGLRLRLRCTACGYEREHHVETVYYDLATQERREKGEPTPYSEFIIPQRITCPKCGAVDRYELSSMAYIALMTEMLKKIAAHEVGRPGGEPEEGAVRFIRFGLSDGREMHPLAAREMYRQKVEAEPNRADLRVRYANVLRFLGYGEEAIEQYRVALRLEPSNLEAYLNLGRFARGAGDLAEARRMFQSILTQAPS